MVLQPSLYWKVSSDSDPERDLENYQFSRFCAYTTVSSHPIHSSMGSKPEGFRTKGDSRSRVRPSIVYCKVIVRFLCSSV